MINYTVSRKNFNFSIIMKNILCKILVDIRSLIGFLKFYLFAKTLSINFWQKYSLIHIKHWKILFLMFHRIFLRLALMTGLTLKEGHQGQMLKVRSIWNFTWPRERTKVTQKRTTGMTFKNTRTLSVCS